MLWAHGAQKVVVGGTTHAWGRYGGDVGLGRGMPCAMLHDEIHFMATSELLMSPFQPTSDAGLRQDAHWNCVRAGQDMDRNSTLTVLGRVGWGA